MARKRRRTAENGNAAGNGNAGDGDAGNNRRLLALLGGSIIIWLVVPGVFYISMVFPFKSFKGYSFLDALYAATVTITTVGYGDTIPNAKEPPSCNTTMPPIFQ